MRDPVVRRAGIYITLWMIGGIALGIYALTIGSVIAGILMLLGAAGFLGILIKGLWMRRPRQRPRSDE